MSKKTISILILAGIRPVCLWRSTTGHRNTDNRPCHQYTACYQYTGSNKYTGCGRQPDTFADPNRVSCLTTRQTASIRHLSSVM